MNALVNTLVNANTFQNSAFSNNGKTITDYCLAPDKGPVGVSLSLRISAMAYLDFFP